MNELTNSGSRRRKNKSKDFAGSPLANMFQNNTSKKTSDDSSKETPTNEVENKTESKTNEQELKTKVDVQNVVKEQPTKTESNSLSNDLLSKLPKKHKRQGIELIKKQNDDEINLTKTVDGKYQLAKNTMYKKVKNIPKTLSMREDLSLILDDITKKGDTGSYIRGLKSTIVANGIMRELYEIGAISKEDLKRELRPYE